MASSQCCENPPDLSSTSGQGSVGEIAGLKSYINCPSDSKHAVLLVSDVFGFEAPNLRKLADKVATAGFCAVVPDFMHGDPYDPSNTSRPLMEWLKDHGVDKGTEEAKAVVAALKSKGISAIGAVGFCWGAKVVVELGKLSLINSAVLCHPSLVTVEDIKEVKAHIAILGAETDHFCPPELVKQFEEVLSAKSEVNCFVKIFPGVAHGWTVRYSEDDETAVKKAEEAHQDLLGWFTKYVK